MSEETTYKELSHEEMQKMLALHILKNDHLREEILKDPKGTLERDLNIKFKENLKINVVNHTEAEEVTFILPYSVHKAMGSELSDDQLEEVAGGISFKSFATGAANVVGALASSQTSRAYGGTAPF